VTRDDVTLLLGLFERSSINASETLAKPAILTLDRSGIYRVFESQTTRVHSIGPMSANAGGDYVIIMF